MNTHWRGAPETSSSYFKVVVSFERRPDGGLRAWCDDVPGLILSHADPERLMSDVKPAIETLLTARFGKRIAVDPLGTLSGRAGAGDIDAAQRSDYPDSMEFVAHAT